MNPLFSTQRGLWLSVLVQKTVDAQILFNTTKSLFFPPLNQSVCSLRTCCCNYWHAWQNPGRGETSSIYRVKILFQVSKQWLKMVWCFSGRWSFPDILAFVSHSYGVAYNLHYPTTVTKHKDVLLLIKNPCLCTKMAEWWCNDTELEMALCKQSAQFHAIVITS